jgi:hypothetical protein
MKPGKTTAASSMALVLGLTACGGSGGSVNPLPPPPPPAAGVPAPPPAPAPPKPPVNPGPIGLTQAGDFSALSFGYTYVSGPDGGQAKEAATSAQNVEFRYLAAEKAYEILIPGFNRGRLQTISYNGSVCSDGTVCDPSSSFNAVTDGNSAAQQDVKVTLLDPDFKDGPVAGLTHTSFGNWDGRIPDPGNPNQPLVYAGTFVYGIPTAPGDVPVSGSATYDASVQGVAIFAGGNKPAEFVGGSARLIFDFGAGTLAGHMDPTITDGWDEMALSRYTFAEAVYSRGATAFSGRFDAPGVSGSSSFDGRFNGPQASELMARWTAPFVDPLNRGTGTMSGLWLGKKK